MMLDYTFTFSLFILVCSARIIKRQDVNVSLGQDATFSCELPDAGGVKQVIWQQSGADGTLRNMVTFTERSRPQVDDAFLGKVNVTVASVRATTIVIKNVSFADEACYVCTFSVYPSGTERETACLSVQGISEVKLHRSHDPTEKDTVVSCSATGKPTPEITWWSGNEELSNYSSTPSTVKNEDSTLTTTSNFTVLQSQFSGKQLTCMVKIGTLERTEIFTVKNKINQETPVASRYYIFSAVVMISCVVVASCVVVLYHLKRTKPQKVPLEIV